MHAYNVYRRGLIFWKKNWGKKIFKMSDFLFAKGFWGQFFI